jgi:short-subunit dehydrogenase
VTKLVGLVTGGSNGIGEALAHQMAAAGHDLVLVARGEAGLRRVGGEIAEAHGVDVEILAADLSDPDELATVESRLSSADAPVELLVNNAGVGSVGSFASLPLEGEIAQLDTNVGALVRLTHSALPLMIDRGHGGVLNVASLGAFQPAPLNATYAATKAFVLSFTEAIHEEVLRSGVRVTCLCPGFTRTGFQARSGMEAAAVPERLWMSAADVAAAGWSGWDANRAVVVPGAVNKAGAGLARVLPRSVVRKMAKRVADSF